MSTKKCFVIAPIGEENSTERKRVDSIIRDVLQPILGSQYHVTAAHKIAKPGIITSQIVEMIFESDLIIADLTNVNGNVMYELAIAHLKEKQVLIIADKSTRLPFDISHQRVIFYEDNIQGSFTLKNDIENAINKIASEPSVENPISIALNKNRTTLVSENAIKNTIKEAVFDAVVSNTKRNQKSNSSNQIMNNVVKNIDSRKTDKIITTYIRTDKQFDSEKFISSLSYAIENKKFPEQILKADKRVRIHSKNLSFEFDYTIKTKTHLFLLYFGSTIFRITLQDTAIKIIRLFNEIENYDGYTKDKIQPIIVVPSEMPNAGKLILKMLPILKYNSSRSEFINWNIIVADFGKIRGYNKQEKGNSPFISH